MQPGGSGHSLGSWPEGLWPFGGVLERGGGRSAQYVIMCILGHVPVPAYTVFTVV
jgi:hypothetical protein